MCHITANKITVVQAEGNADTVIVSQTLQIASKCHQNSLAMFADDTDVLVMLIRRMTDTMDDIYFISDTKTKANKETD